MPEDAVPDSSRRSYRSPLRAEQAARTREAITRAARELFEAEGFAGTTIAAVATRAGVSAQTVYSAFGSKAGVVRAILGQMEGSAQAEKWSARIATESDPERILGAFAQWTCAFFAASKPVMGLTAAAAPELVELMVQGDAHRREGVTELVDRVAEMGALRRGLSRRRAVDRVWMLTGVQTFLAATQGCGWSERAYASWLTETLAQQVLEPDPSART